MCIFCRFFLCLIPGQHSVWISILDLQLVLFLLQLHGAATTGIEHYIHADWRFKGSSSAYIFIHIVEQLGPRHILNVFYFLRFHIKNTYNFTKNYWGLGYTYVTSGSTLWLSYIERSCGYGSDKGIWNALFYFRKLLRTVAHIYKSFQLCAVYFSLIVSGCNWCQQNTEHITRKDCQDNPKCHKNNHWQWNST